MHAVYVMQSFYVHLHKDIFSLDVNRHHHACRRDGWHACVHPKCRPSRKCACTRACRHMCTLDTKSMPLVHARHHRFCINDGFCMCARTRACVHTGMHAAYTGSRMSLPLEDVTLACMHTCMHAHAIEKNEHVHSFTTAPSDVSDVLVKNDHTI